MVQFGTNSLAYLGSSLGLQIVGVAHNSPLGSLPALLDKLFVDVLLHEGPGASRAHLTGIDENAPVANFHCVVDCDARDQ